MDGAGADIDPTCLHCVLRPINVLAVRANNQTFPIVRNCVKQHVYLRMERDTGADFTMGT